MAREFVDALGRAVRIGVVPRRIVSLVPSETESLVELVGESPLVGRTDYCVEPASVANVPSVGGTKSIDVDAVIRLAPDLVLANKEENARVPVQRLIDAGVCVFVSFPRSVAESAAWFDTLASILQVGDQPAVVRAREATVRSGVSSETQPAPVRVFVPIWRDPWMTLNADTYGHDLLRLAGAENVFHDRRRRVPLAADLGRRPEAPSASHRDTRYPRVTLDEVRAHRPALLLLAG